MPLKRDGSSKPGELPPLSQHNAINIEDDLETVLAKARQEYVDHLKRQYT